MTKEEAIKELKEELKEVITWLAITINKEEMYERKERRKRAIEAAIKALEIVNDFETARIITGGRLNGRTYAYKCGLADGQRLAKGEKLFNILPPVTPQQTMWIPIKTRPMTEEEKEEIGHEYAFMYDCPLPYHGQEVLVTDCYGNVEIDTFCRDHEGFYFEDNCDDGEVIAWMPKPEGYKAESEDKE